MQYDAELHCGGGPGPDVVCAYPYVHRYDGKGDPEDASSYDCKPNFGRWGAPGAIPSITNGTTPIG